MKALWLVSGLIVGLGLAAFSACDPVASDEVNDLPADSSRERNGPLHRAGQRCGVCHDGKLGDPQQFSVSGTIYVDEDATTAAYGATISLTDVAGKTFSTTANEVGNFYIRPDEFTPQYPMKVSVSYSGIDVKMSSEVGRGGSCAECHFAPAGPTSAGPVFIPADGGTP